MSEDNDKEYRFMQALTAIVAAVILTVILVRTIGCFLGTVTSY